jgi:hypothetical protein
MNLKTRLRRVVIAAVAGTVAVGVGMAGGADAGAGTQVAVNHSPASSRMHLTVAVTKPSKPRAPTAKPGNARVKLAWLAPSSTGGGTINQYAVQRSRTGTSNWKSIAHPTRRSFTAVGLHNGVRYYFRMRAHNAAGWGPYSTVVSAVPRTVPTAPRSPTAKPANASVELAWLAPSSNGGAKIDKYRVQRATTSSGPWTNIATPTTRSYTAIGLANGTGYHFRIRAHNAAGWGTFSTIVIAVPHTVPGAPASPVATPGNSTVALSWQPPPSNGGAKIDLYRVQEESIGVWYDVGFPTGTTYTAGGLLNGSTHTYRILAHNPAGWGTPSPTVQAVPFTNPAAPMKLVATSGKDWISLTWNPPLGDGGRPVQNYLLSRSTTLNGTYGSIKSTPSLSYLESGLAPGTTYYYKVYACNIAGCGPQSVIVSAHVPTLPSKPATCQASQVYGPGSDWVRVEWTPPVDNGGAPILDYKIHIYYSWDHATAQPLGNETSTDIYMPLDSSGSPYNGHYNYSFAIAARNAAGIGAECGSSFSMYP